jgi:hypothetical protein
LFCCFLPLAGVFLGVLGVAIALPPFFLVEPAVVAPVSAAVRRRFGFIETSEGSSSVLSLRMQRFLLTPLGAQVASLAALSIASYLAFSLFNLLVLAAFSPFVRAWISELLLEAARLCTKGEAVALRL